MNDGLMGSSASSDRDVERQILAGCSGGADRQVRQLFSLTPHT